MLHVLIYYITYYMSFWLKLVIPNQLVSNLHIPNSREGIVQVTDITNDIAEAGTVGYLKVSEKNPITVPTYSSCMNDKGLYFVDTC